MVAGAAVTKVLVETALDIGADLVLGHYEDRETTVDSEVDTFTSDATHRPMKVSYVSVKQVRKRGFIPRTVHRTLVTGNLYACPFCGKNIHTVLLPKRPLPEVVARTTAAILAARIGCRHFPYQQVLS